MDIRIPELHCHKATDSQALNVRTALLVLLKKQLCLVSRTWNSSFVAGLLHVIVPQGYRLSSLHTVQIFLSSRPTAPFVFWASQNLRSQKSKLIFFKPVPSSLVPCFNKQDQHPSSCPGQKPESLTLLGSPHHQPSPTGSAWEALAHTFTSSHLHCHCLAHPTGSYLDSWSADYNLICLQFYCLPLPLPNLYTTCKQTDLSNT